MSKPSIFPRSSVRVVKRHVTGPLVGDPEEDFLAIEDPLEISIGVRQQRQILSVTMRTPGNDDDLITGFLFAERIISQASDIERFEFENTKAESAPVRATAWLSPETQPRALRMRAQTGMHSSCGVCGTGELAHLSLPRDLTLIDNLRIRPEDIHTLPLKMRQAQPTFSKTGGLHAAALFSHSCELIVVREDIGRHNALDKAVGACLKSGQFPAPILCVSGRMSYEILQKAILARVPVIAGVGAPSSLAVTLAMDFGVTLLGFVRNGSFNIYSGDHRVSQ